MTRVTAGSTRASAAVEMPDELRADVRMLGDVLGDVLREYGGQALLDEVVRLRELTIAAHVDDPVRAEQAALQAEQAAAALSLERAQEVARAFTVWFHLVNLAEQYHRIRSLRRADTVQSPLPETVAEAVTHVTDLYGPAHAQAMLAGLEVRPVLTAHPTEARRRAVAATIRRISDLLTQRDDPRLGASERAELRRRLAEDVDVLWRTAVLRDQPPTPLDEVRTSMQVFDDVLFRLMPVLYRAADSPLAGPDAGRVPPRVPAFVRFGTWIGGDRDGNPFVTAAVTRQAMAIQSDHVLRALEAACTRIGRALTVDASSTPPSPNVRRLLGDAHAAHPDLLADLTTRGPEEPHKILLTFVAERLRATRTRNADLAYQSSRDLTADLVLVQRSLAAAGANRQAYGELQHLIWQADTFGFHLAELEIRQHSLVHQRALEEVRRAGPLSPETEEVLATFRALHQLQQRFGPEAARRYVVSFTQSAADVAAVFELARAALDDKRIVLDVVPLFETGDDLARAVEVLDAMLDLPDIRRRLSATGRRLEVMLGYSDSAKDVGPVAATVALDEAQSQMAAWAARHAVRLTLFHGRGGALGRGGGPVHRAVLAQAPGSVSGRFKVTEQGEVIFARYGEQTIARRHLEQVTAAVVLASTAAIEERNAAAADRFADLGRVLADASRDAYHRLVHTEGFAEWFARATPLDEIGGLSLGSRPARRAMAVAGLGDLRAIPWVFSWSQARVNVPGWYGLGTALVAAGDRFGADEVRAAAEGWPLFRVLLENVEMSLAKSDRRIMTRYLEIGGRPDLMAQVLDEHERTVTEVLGLTGQPRLMSGRPVLGRAIDLRNPYVDALSYLQLRALRGLRADDTDEADRTDLRRLMALTVNGMAAGLQNTG
jgi:phosphoenolpyruvate carboxylase